MTDEEGPSYTPDAWERLDELEREVPVELYNAVLICIEYIFDNTAVARQKAPPLQDRNGKAVYSTVVMHEKDPRWFVFWRLESFGAVIVGVGELPDFRPI